MGSILWIDGKWTDFKGGGIVEVENPATGEIVGQVSNASAADVDAAVQAAKTAFYDGRWSRQTPKDRSKVLAKMADIVEARQEEIARIESEDSGKPYEFISLGADLPFCVDNLRFLPQPHVIPMVAMPESMRRDIPRSTAESPVV